MTDKQPTHVKKFCFTLNNSTPEEEEAVQAFASEKSAFAVIGHEIGECLHTPHLQGYMNLKRNARFAAIKKIMPRAHIEIARGSDEDNLAYCTKTDATPFIVGKPVKTGKRTDLELFKEFAQRGGTYAQALEEHSEVVAKYRSFAREYISKCKQDQVPPLVIKEMYPWQQHILDLLAQPPDDRHIIWVVDFLGGTGKTHLAKYLRDHNGAAYFSGGKSADIYYLYNYESIVIFDFVRDSQEYVNYGAIEGLKNGILSSTKYECELKRFNVPHVLVFANFMPCKGKFSRDRIVLVDVSPPGTLKPDDCQT